MHYQRIPLLRNRKVTGVLFTLSILFAAPHCEADDLSKCKKFISSVIKRQVPQIHKYNDTENRRFSKQMKKFVTGSLFTKECCNGYINITTENETTARCTPVCPSGCKNGKCYRPNECICDIGYSVSLNNSTGHSECISSCREKCNGGICIGVNTCACEPGYVLSKDRRICKALCIDIGGGGPQGCGEYATCFAPNVCKCHDGYKNNRNGSLPVCLPVSNTTCDRKTVDGSPKKCLCNTDGSGNDTLKKDDDKDVQHSDNEDDDYSDEDDEKNSPTTEFLYEIIGAVLGSAFGGIIGKCWRCCCPCCSKKKTKLRESVV